MRAQPLEDRSIKESVDIFIIQNTTGREGSISQGLLITQGGKKKVWQKNKATDTPVKLGLNLRMGTRDAHKEIVWSAQRLLTPIWS